MECKHAICCWKKCFQVEGTFFFLIPCEITWVKKKNNVLLALPLSLIFVLTHFDDQYAKNKDTLQYVCHTICTFDWKQTEFRKHFSLIQVVHTSQKDICWDYSVCQSTIWLYDAASWLNLYYSRVSTGLSIEKYFRNFDELFEDIQFKICFKNCDNLLNF